MAKKILLGTALFLVVLTASFYILMPDKVRIDFEKTRTIFKVYEDGKFVISGIEYVRLFDGTKLMRANDRIIDYIISDILTIVERKSYFKEGIIIEDFYDFENNVTNVENVPISHKICFTNAENKIFEYMIDKITYEGETKDITSPFSFGKNMKLTFQDGYYRAKVYNYKYASDKIKIRYRITEDYQCFEVRLFDPVIEKIESKLETIKDCWIEYWNITENIYGDCVYYYNTIVCSDEPINKSCKMVQKNYTHSCVVETKTIEKSEEVCNTLFYKYDDEVFNASEWCCYNELCGLIKDYDCNYIQEQRKQPNHSFKELNTGILKIDAKELKEHYLEEKPKLEAVDISSFTIE